MAHSHSQAASIQAQMDQKQKQATLDIGSNFSKRDDLIRLERDAQRKWQDANIFQTDSPYTTDPKLEELSREELRKQYPKFFGTFPYPYMNGSLHLGHAFTISKIEFAVGFERMRGRRALFPVGWHATGMPIKSAADKIVREMEQFGENLERFQPDPTPPDEPAATDPQAANTAVVQDKSKAKKGKIQAKSTGLQYQFQIMESIGIPKEDIKKFADPQYWLTYFPPIAKNDLNAFGARVDWRRSFITTDINPYYDAFVRWQMNKLKEKGYVKFGERYTIYSPKDGQPCMDHDRASGERLGTQEYTCLKMKVIEWGPQAGALRDQVSGREVFFVAATLRPETMYGQTNCFVGPKIEYGLFEMQDGSLYVCTARAARNMSFQNITLERGVINQVASIEGSLLYGTKIEAPNAVHQAVYILPMETVLATKGTGVVTSVPSDSPDDYINLVHLRKKAAYYGLDPAWVSLDPVPVLTTPEYGPMSAPTLVGLLKIDSPKDALKLAEAKEKAYKAGFYQGVMAIGKFAGQSVESAKPKVRDDLIANGLAFAYCEPEGLIVSRSGDECVVALCDQWYLDYGEPTWQAKAFKLLEQMNIRDPPTKKKFQEDLEWLHQWACARSYGLGSRLPWDPQFLVESLSDSTIYMAYYTISHLLHGGDIYGRQTGPLGVTAAQMTDGVWDYIFGTDAVAFPAPPPPGLPKHAADLLRREFRYFYPMDVRSSGKDLISNHLSFCIYVHTALFDPQFWPRTMRANGHLMLNGKKMSKSTGNSLTLSDSLRKFGADATRLTLADSGDGFDDANFEELAANASILRLHTLLEWSKDVIANHKSYRSGQYTLFDHIFENETKLAINKAYKAYDESMYKEALKVGFYELLGARDWYRDFTAEEGGMHGDLLRYYVRIQTLLIAPIAPHFAEHVWSVILEESGSIQNAAFPAPEQAVDWAMIEAAEYVKATVRNVRTTEMNLAKRKTKAKAAAPPAFDPSKPKRLRIFIAHQFPEWQAACILALKNHWDPDTRSVDDKALRDELVKLGMFKDKRTMPFMMMMKGKIQTNGVAALDRKLGFDEFEVLEKAQGYLCRTLGLEQIALDSLAVGLEKAKALEAEVSAAQAAVHLEQNGYSVPIIQAAEPGAPAFVVYTP